MKSSTKKKNETGNKRRKLEPGLAGVAGEFYVAAELSRRGYIATLTQRNTEGVDILAASRDSTKSVSIQVKTNVNRKNLWILNRKAEKSHTPSLFYVFVNLNGQNECPEFHIVPSKIVAELTHASHANWLNKPGRRGQAHNDNSIRKFEMSDDRFLGKWELLGLD